MLVLKNSQSFYFLRKMIGVAFAVVFANSQKNTKSMTDSADRFAGDPGFGSGHSLDNGFHDELAVEVAGFFSLGINWMSQGYVAAKKRRPGPSSDSYYLVTKKITVDNAAEGRGKTPGRGGRVRRPLSMWPISRIKDAVM
jgi:hypothetical protein